MSPKDIPILRLYLVRVSGTAEIERKEILAGSASIIEAGMKAAESAAKEAAKRAAKGG